METKTYEITVENKIELTSQDIEDIMVTALEGGIGYWARLDNTGDAYKNAPKEEPVSITCARELLAGNNVFFEDVEEDGSEYVLNLHMLLKGIGQWIDANMTSLKGLVMHGSIDTYDIDAAIADEIIQYALFGEIVFG